MSSSRPIAWLLSIFVFALACAGRLHAGQPDGRAAEDWKAAALRYGLSPQDIEQLSKNKLIVGGTTFKQVFEPYTASGRPVFITSDSLLAGFHVLFEDSLLRLERANARKLPTILKTIWTKLDHVDERVRGRPQLAATAKKRARLVIAVALHLLGDDATGLDDDFARVVTEEVERIVAAQGIHKPEWLDPPDPGFVALDYSRYRPRGFYTKSADLVRYFRAVTWLQSVPFRVANDEELLAIWLLGACAFEPSDGEIHRFVGCFEELIGTADDWDILGAAERTQGPRVLDLDGPDLADERDALVKKAKGESELRVINDLVTFKPRGSSNPAELGFRVLSAYRTPESTMFQSTVATRRNTVATRREGRFPTGLEICAALGSDFARSRLAKREGQRLAETVDASRPLFAGNSLHQEYLQCMAALLDAPEPDAPAFMASEPWRIKSCQTALSGWVQLRHAWTLHAKECYQTSGFGDLLPAGFVEPDPEFFSRLAGLTDRTERLLEDAGALGPDWKGLASDLRDLAVLIKTKLTTNQQGRGFEKVTEEEKLLIGEFGSLLAQLGVWEKNQPRKSPDEIAAVLTRLAARVDQRRLAEDDGSASIVPEQLLFDNRRLWREFAGLCRRLESLAHKQLRGVPFSDDDSRFIRGYGKKLADVMFYQGDSSDHPRDDAPRVVDVFHDAGQHLSVGVGRPREFFVLYPTKNGEVFCHGAVVPYFEFLSETRLTDAEWLKRLNTTDQPEAADWLEPIMGSGLPGTETK